MNRIIARILLGLPGLFILTTGIVFLANPEAASDKLVLVAQGAEGLSNLRGLFGAPIFAVGASLVLAAITQQLVYARPAALFLLALIGSRIVSYFVDGAAQPIGLFLTVPSVAFSLMVAGHVLLARADAAEEMAVVPS